MLLIKIKKTETTIVINAPSGQACEVLEVADEYIVCETPPEPSPSDLLYDGRCTGRYIYVTLNVFVYIHYYFIS